MKDSIFLEGLAINCIIGIFDWERKTKQKVVIDLEFPSNIKKAARRDDIRDATDYKKIAKRTIDFVSKSQYQLVETLADRLAETLMKEFKLKALKLRLSKPGAIRGSKNVGIELIRKRK